ncbi:MAG: hypothetical protein GY795_29040 [Desulfobacterales bacterium]|nr:hypothetical protein [Desulfobacterales bacterium]
MKIFFIFISLILLNAVTSATLAQVNTAEDYYRLFYSELNKSSVFWTPSNIYNIKPSKNTGNPNIATDDKYDSVFWSLSKIDNIRPSENTEDKPLNRTADALQWPVHDIISSTHPATCLTESNRLWHILPVEEITGITGEQPPVISAEPVGTNIRKTFRTSSGKYYIGTDSGLSLRTDSGQYKNYTIYNGLVANLIHDFAEDDKGRVWIATEGGISIFDNGRFINIPCKRGFINAAVIGLTCIGKKIIAFAANNDIFLFEGNFVTGISPDYYYETGQLSRGKPIRWIALLKPGAGPIVLTAIPGK